MLQTLTRDLVVLGNFGNHLAAVGVRAGKVIDVLGFAADDRFVRIQVDGEIFEVFESDILDQTESFASDWRKLARAAT